LQPYPAPFLPRLMHRQPKTMTFARGLRRGMTAANRSFQALELRRSMRGR
jgi:hypothetical protein